MSRYNYITGIIAFILLVVLQPLSSDAAEIKGPDVSLRDRNIIVSTSLNLSNGELDEIKQGIAKEIVFYIDLFRVWNYWPDEFILGKTFTNTLRCDPVKKEYIAASLSGTTLTEKRFRSCEALLKWTLEIKDLRLTNTSELPPDKYFVEVRVESRLRRLPPVIGSLFFFVRETEFELVKASAPFIAGGAR